MSNITTVYGKVTDLIEATWPTHVRLPNPYDISANTFLHMKDSAFGLMIEEAEDSERNVGCLLSWRQTYSIPLIKRIVTTQNNMAAREILELGILTDYETLIKAFANNVSLDGTVISARIRGHNGLALETDGNQKFFITFITLEVEHQDTY